MTVASDDPLAGADEQLLAALDAQIVSHDTGARQARRDRRQVWLRMFEAGAKYKDLMTLSGVSKAVVYDELCRARKERPTP